MQPQLWQLLNTCERSLISMGRKFAKILTTVMKIIFVDESTDKAEVISICFLPL